MDPILLDDYGVLHSSLIDRNPLKDMSSALKKTINKIVEAEGYIMHTIQKKVISTCGGNYMSLLTEIDIKGKTSDKVKETNLFIKHCLPESDKNIMSPQELLSKEIFVYIELAKVFADLQNEYNVPQKERFNLIKCYNNDDDYSNSLILENMVKQGFKTYNRLEVMPLKAMHLAVAHIAKFHAFSIILKQFKLDFFINKIQNKEHPFNFNNDNATTFFKNVCYMSIDILDDERKVKIEKCLPKLLKDYENYLHKNNSKTKCLCHGDYRMNNILVKELDGEATTVIPVDFQATYYGSPVTDLLYLIFSSTDRHTRKNEMENLKRIYFESLRKFLQYFNIDVELVYTQKEFEFDFKNQLDYALTLSLILLPFILTAEDDIPELDEFPEKAKFHENFKPRLEEIVDDFIEWGYL